MPRSILTADHPFETIYLKVMLGAEDLQAKMLVKLLFNPRVICPQPREPHEGNKVLRMREKNTKLRNDRFVFYSRRFCESRVQLINIEDAQENEQHG